MVGVYSWSSVQGINFKYSIDQLIAFFTIATMGFTYR
jgi:xanthine/uracil/vitamin C permease (AzgA family)